MQTNYQTKKMPTFTNQMPAVKCLTYEITMLSVNSHFFLMELVQGHGVHMQYKACTIGSMTLPTSN